jgi:hypothetical protein
VKRKKSAQRRFDRAGIVRDGRFRRLPDLRITSGLLVIQKESVVLPLCLSRCDSARCFCRSGLQVLTMDDWRSAARNLANRALNPGKFQEDASPDPCCRPSSVPQAPRSLNLEESRNWDAVDVSLDGCAIERVDISRWAGNHALGIDPPRSRKLGYLLIRMKSSCRNPWQSLAWRQR